MENEQNYENGSTLESDFMIEGWLVRPQLNRIELQGKVIQVQPKIMRVLLILARYPGQVVTRDCLLQTAWADTHVTPHVLARAISELRKIFNDNPQDPSFIETIPKTGYRLIARVSRIRNQENEDAAQNTQPGSDVAVDPSGRQSTVPPAASRSTTLVWAGALMTFLVFALLVFGRLMHQH
ncbi:MAG TPA: transcriptional regulator [Pyrinomonadaceae bacterium]|nr:transcriptional regulator [Pyrinomonadaceae bacterium]